LIPAEDRKELLLVARRSIEAALRSEPYSLQIPDSGPLAEARGAFVTLTRGGVLRGCIGRVTANEPLLRVVSEMAIASAREDYRFSPVRKEELSQIHIEISALTPPRTIQDASEIQVGRHGLIIRKGSSSGLLLPQVASERHWDVPRFLEETCRKAGLPADAWREGATIELFEAEVWGEEE